MTRPLGLAQGKWRCSATQLGLGRVVVSGFLFLGCVAQASFWFRRSLSCSWLFRHYLGAALCHITVDLSIMAGRIVGTLGPRFARYRESRLKTCLRRPGSLEAWRQPALQLSCFDMCLARGHASTSRGWLVDRRRLAGSSSHIVRKVQTPLISIYIYI